MTQVVLNISVQIISLITFILLLLTSKYLNAQCQLNTCQVPNNIDQVCCGCMFYTCWLFIRLFFTSVLSEQVPALWKGHKECVRRIIHTGSYFSLAVYFCKHNNRICDPTVELHRGLWWGRRMSRIKIDFWLCYMDFYSCINGPLSENDSLNTRASLAVMIDPQGLNKYVTLFRSGC